MKIFILFTLLFVQSVIGSVVDRNITNVGVYLNKISSCNYNTLNGNLLCASQEFDTLVQYHSVDKIKMCDYHYCVRFFGEENVLSCTGYVLKLIGGKMDEYINPLTNNNKLNDFSADSTKKHIVRKLFLGYNVLIDSFNQNVQTKFNSKIIDIECKEPHETCILLEGNEEHICFGSTDYTFHDTSTSLILGILIPSAFAFILYLSNSFICSQNIFIIYIFIPVLVFICSFLILFEAQHFIVKIYPFITSSVIGVICGYFLSSQVYKCFFKKKKIQRSDDQEVRETLKNIDRENSTEFVIDENQEPDEQGMVEIELQRKNKDEEEFTV